MEIASFLNNLEFSDEHVMISPLIDNAFTKEIRIEFKVEDSVHVLNQGDVISLEGAFYMNSKRLKSLWYDSSYTKVTLWLELVLF